MNRKQTKEQRETIKTCGAGMAIGTPDGLAIHRGPLGTFLIDQSGNLYEMHYVKHVLEMMDAEVAKQMEGFTGRLS